ncbi:hypothetical protein VTJ49DRAFT_5595 [Mycothermus thermophilus]|uniref:Uncharacterized protein n=1 Tax=Humicola insolens TaxID=85995 RepID=A0ABR3VKI6_HUMIN
MALLKPRPREADHLRSRPLQVPDYKGPIEADDKSMPATPDRVSRSSFSSIREHDNAQPQTFSHTKVSSYHLAGDYSSDEAVVDDSDHDADHVEIATKSSGRHAHKMIEARFQPPVTNPGSRLLGYWTPADSFQGWKGIQVKGKFASKSFGDLQILHHVFSSPSRPPKRGQNRPGEAPIERLPTEILTSIISLLALDVPPNGVTRRNVDLMSLLLTSKTMHIATLSTLYSKITIPHSRIFHKFLTHISAHPNLGTIVRRLDFCHFNPAQLFLTAAERSKARNLTSETLLRCLELTPNLQEFLAQEYIDEDLSTAVLKKLFLGLPQIKALDFCGCTSPKFRDAFVEAIDQNWPKALTVRRLSLHKCLTLPSSVFDILLPRMPHLTHLDVAGTRITDEALASIPVTARLTHLNLAKCTLLTARGIIDFLAKHPAARELEFLSLAADARSHQVLDADHVTELLPLLPHTLKSLSLKGSKMDAAHINLLRPLTKHLEELALGRSLRLQDVNRLFVPDEENANDDVAMQLDWVPHTLRFLDLSDFWGAELDLAYLCGNTCVLLKSLSEPLEVIEIAEDVARRVRNSSTALQRMGWDISECGSRTWMVKKRGGAQNASRDDGSRRWKMGAESWGMRKIPVARAEVGGMYGSFMFGRKL